MLKELKQMTDQGAFCLKPKRGFYVDEAVAVVDYSSLYPSSMISENISHDSGLDKEYNLKGELIKITGERDGKGNFIYDNLKNINMWILNTVLMYM